MIQGSCTGLAGESACDQSSILLDHREILVASLAARPGDRCIPDERKRQRHAFTLHQRTENAPRAHRGHGDGSGNENVLIVANSEDVLFFDRLATGDVAPLGEIKGEHTGIRNEPGKSRIHNGQDVYLAASNHLHVIYMPRSRSGRNTTMAAPASGGPVAESEPRLHRHMECPATAGTCRRARKSAVRSAGLCIRPASPSIRRTADYRNGQHSGGGGEPGCSPIWFRTAEIA